MAAKHADTQGDSQADRHMHSRPGMGEADRHMHTRPGLGEADREADRDSLLEGSGCELRLKLD